MPDLSRAVSSPPMTPRSLAFLARHAGGWRRGRRETITIRQDLVPSVTRNVGGGARGGAERRGGGGGVPLPPMPPWCAAPTHRRGPASAGRVVVLLGGRHRSGTRGRLRVRVSTSPMARPGG